VGFIGETGSGKSTLIDLIMALLKPTSGQVEVDGIPLNHENYRAWQLRIAHVPQSIYLSDATIAENIAFGVPLDKIDLSRIKLASKKAQLSEFIESQPKKYQTHVGERGVRLSGGQRQRIGLARALYKQADILVLDEATSALDDLTEQSVMSAINALESELTVLMIAHRVSTLRSCDRIVELGDKSVLRVGTYDDLIGSKL
jgi:ATP-binding cassette subfamily B protein